jgi:hypothetical protein
MDVRLFGRIPLVAVDDEDTARSAAGRAALEAVWAPASLLPDRGVRWSAEGDQTIVATWDVPPEHPRLRLGIDERGALRDVCLMRWDGGGHGRRGYIPCGGTVHAERRFGGLTIPTRISSGWWFGTERWDPFFEATVTAAATRA